MSSLQKGAGAGDDDEQARARALALLEATHQFPCHYAVTVIAFNRPSVTDALLATCSVADVPAAVDATPAYQTRASSEGKYISHRFSVPVADAAEVLELYARLRSVEGVVTIL